MICRLIRTPVAVAIAAVGFKAVELQFPFDVAPSSVKATIARRPSTV
mgnify:CR=1 FL=1